MKNNVFDFGVFKHTEINTYLLMIKDKHIRAMVSNFFDKSIISNVPKKEVMKLIKAINDDVENGIFSVDYHQYNGNISSSFNLMGEEQLKSNTHKLFLNIIGKHFGKSAEKLLKNRKNLNIFNIKEIHVMHQSVFDDFGESFVNNILNVDLSPHSLILIKDILTDKEKKEDFKIFYDFYKNNIGFSRVNFEKMVRGYKKYQPLLRDIRKNKKTNEHQKSALVEIFRDVDNKYNIKSVKDLNFFYETKDKEYEISKKKSAYLLKKGDNNEAIKLLANAIFKNYYAMNMNPSKSWAYYISHNDPLKIKEFFDVDSIVNNEEDLGKMFSEYEIKGLKDLMSIVDLVEKENPSKGDYLKLCEYAEKLESDGNKVYGKYLEILDKLHKTFEYNMVNCISTVESIEQRANSEEKGIFIEENAKTKEGDIIDSPVYVFAGADFSFLSTTNFVNRVSIDDRERNLASLWFEYENGTSHICCSFTNQDCLNNLEFNQKFGWPGEKVTYLFDEAKILLMSSSDIKSPIEARYSDLYAHETTKFMAASKIAKETTFMNYNEVDIERFDLDKGVQFGGKVVPSAILCSDEISKIQAETAEMFTKYCVENGLRPQGWKMPLVVVKKDEYTELARKRRKSLIMKNSEYFLQEDKTEIKENDIVEETKVKEYVVNKR